MGVTGALSLGSVTGLAESVQLGDLPGKFREAFEGFAPNVWCEDALSYLLKPAASESASHIFFDWKLYIGLFLWLGVWTSWFQAPDEYRHKVVSRYAPTALMVLGVDLAALSILQHIGAAGFVLIIMMTITNVLLTKKRFSGKGLEPPKELNEEVEFTADCLYSDLGAELPQIVMLFLGQFLLLIFVIYSSFGSYDPSSVSYGFWATAYIAVQMSGFFKRGKDSQLGGTWDLETFKDLIEMNEAVEYKGERKSDVWATKKCLEMKARNKMGLWVNTLFRDIVAFMTPLLLMQSDSATDFVQNAFAMSYITTLDNIGDAKTFSVRLRRANTSRSEVFSNVDSFGAESGYLLTEGSTATAGAGARP